MKSISEKYIRSRLRVYFLIFLFKRSILRAHLNKLIFRKGLLGQIKKNLSLNV